jgi:hypothetical protein
MGRVHSTFITEFSVKTHKSEVAAKPWDRTMVIGKISAGKRGVG